MNGPVSALVSYERLDALEASIGVRFDDRTILLRSLAHRSWCAENGEPESNERLEFLGDSVLGLVVTHYVFEHFPSLPEGQLSEVRAGVVNARVLAELALELDLGPYLLARQGRGRGRRAREAVDPRRRVRGRDRGGLPRSGIRGRARPRVALPLGADRRRRGRARAAATTRRACRRPPRPGRSAVRATSSGTRDPITPKQFFATVYVNDRRYGEGEGRSKKQAEQAAAWVAWTRLQEEADGQGGDDAGAT